MGRLTAWTLAGLVLCASAARGGERAEPPNPFGVKKAPRPEAVPGKLVRSDGAVHRGRIFLTRDKRLELYCDSEKKWYKLKLADLAGIKWVIEFEKEEKEWRWKESGSDVKVLTGRKKIDRRYKTVVTRKDGKKVEGHIRGTVVYVQPEKGKKKKFFIYWNHPSNFDQKPADLIYTKEIHFGTEHAREPKKPEKGSEKRPEPPKAAGKKKEK